MWAVGGAPLQDVASGRAGDPGGTHDKHGAAPIVAWPPQVSPCLPPRPQTVAVRPGRQPGREARRGSHQGLTGRPPIHRPTRLPGGGLGTSTEPAPNSWPGAGVREPVARGQCHPAGRTDSGQGAHARTRMHKHAHTMGTHRHIYTHTPAACRAPCTLHGTAVPGRGHSLGESGEPRESGVSQRFKVKQRGLREGLGGGQRGRAPTLLEEPTPHSGAWQGKGPRCVCWQGVGGRRGKGCPPKGPW